MPQFSPLPPDYQDRVYGGVLGKVIGVYLGRPFEQWSHKAIVERFGEINFYVNEEMGVPIVVADDDISGTFTFLRALEDNDFDPNLTAEQIGETWLNYIIENRTILWWGGRSTSTEHTAFLNLKNGIKAPRSGSMELNGKTVAEQIGSQIFIDGWGLIHPNDPEAAADWARRAASVSHDGEAIYGAQVIAAMVAGAFGEHDLYKLQDLALAQIPADCQIRRLVDDVRELVARYPDWKEGFTELDRTYGYGVYTSNCHIIPNHGLIHFALLHGKGDFQDSMRVVNTCGWDTDCNAGNLGCILGVREGSSGLRLGQPDWISPTFERVIIPTADGGGFTTDVGTITNWIVRAANALRKKTVSSGTRFEFSHRTGVRGFATVRRLSSGAFDMLEPGLHGGLQFMGGNLRPGLEMCVSRPVFATPDQFKHEGYGIMASPMLYPGQRVIATVEGPSKDRYDEADLVDLQLYVSRYGHEDKVIRDCSEPISLPKGSSNTIEFTIPGLGMDPIFEIGFRMTGCDSAGPVTVKTLHWGGVPNCSFAKPSHSGKMWLRQWVNGLSELRDWNGMDCIQNEGTGLAIVGCREWQNYRAIATITFEAAKQSGLAVHVQGMRRFYALVLEPGKLKLIKSRDGLHDLAEINFDWEFDESHDLAIEVQTHSGSVELKGYVDGNLMIQATDSMRPLIEGAIGIVLTEGRARVPKVSIQSLGSPDNS